MPRSTSGAPTTIGSVEILRHRVFRLNTAAGTTLAMIAPVDVLELQTPPGPSAGSARPRTRRRCAADRSRCATCRAPVGRRRRRRRRRWCCRHRSRAASRPFRPPAIREKHVAGGDRRRCRRPLLSRITSAPPSSRSRNGRSGSRSAIAPRSPRPRPVGVAAPGRRGPARSRPPSQRLIGPGAREGLQQLALGQHGAGALEAQAVAGNSVSAGKLATLTPMPRTSQSRPPSGASCAIRAGCRRPCGR